MSHLRAALLAAASIAVLAAPTRAQAPHTTPFAVEVRAGAVFPTGDFNDVANPGYTLGGNITAYLNHVLGVYGGYHYARFGASGDGHFNETGPEAGVRIDFPSSVSHLNPFVKAGLVWNHLERTGAGDADFSDTRTGLQFNGGIAITIRRVSFTPGLTYIRYGYDDGGDDDRTASYLRLDVGVRVRI